VDPIDALRRGLLPDTNIFLLLGVGLVSRDLVGRAVNINHLRSDEFLRS